MDGGGDVAGAEGGGDVFRDEALGHRDGLGLEDPGEEDLIGKGEGVDETVFEDVAAEGVGAGFEDGDEAAAPVAGAERAKGFADGGWVVGEVVDEGDSVEFGAHFEATFDAAEGGEGFNDGFFGNALADGEGGGGGGVEGVVLAGHGEGELGEGFAAAA